MIEKIAKNKKKWESELTTFHCERAIWNVLIAPLDDQHVVSPLLAQIADREVTTPRMFDVALLCWTVRTNHAHIQNILT